MQNHAAARLLPTATVCFAALLGLSILGSACSVQSLGATSDDTDGIADDGRLRSSAVAQPAPPTSVQGDTTTDLDERHLYRAGSCLVGPTLEPETEVVACTQAHTLAVYAADDLDWVVYRGADAAAEHCDAAFTAITGVGVGLATIVERLVLAPTIESWQAGDRRITCYVAYPHPVSAPLAALDPLRGFGLVSRFGLRGGDCLVDFDVDAAAFELVDCLQPHDAEVFATVVVDDLEYPGPVPLDERMEDLCFGQPFEDFVGLAYDASALVAYGHRPTAETWGSGDRTVACILADDQVHTASFAGTGR